jgi:UDP-glucose 4-epimerase
VLVTGASGFIGSHICQRLLEEGAEVHGVSRAVRESSGIRWWQADLTDADATARLVSRIRPDAIYHVAGYASGSRSLDSVLPSLNDNLVAVVNVLIAAAKNECGLVLLTGSLEEPEPVAGESVPTSPYAAAKHAAGSFGRMFVALHELPVVNLRVFMVYGPGQTDQTKLVPYVVTSLLRGESPKLSSGTRPVDWVYVEDVADAFLTAAQRPGLAGETIDIGSGELVTVRSVVEQIAKMMGTVIQPEFGTLPDRPLETVRAANVEQTRDRLGWQPRTSLAEGLSATIEWFGAEVARESSLPLSSRSGD